MSKVIDLYSGKPLVETERELDAEFEKTREDMLQILENIVKEVREMKKNDHLYIYGMKHSNKGTVPFLLVSDEEVNTFEILGGCEVLKQTLIEQLMYGMGKD